LRFEKIYHVGGSPVWGEGEKRDEWGSRRTDVRNGVGGGGESSGKGAGEARQTQGRLICGIPDQGSAEGGEKERNSLIQGKGMFLIGKEKKKGGH